VCQEIWNNLHPTYLPAPTEQIWNEAVEGFSKVWGFPNCLGSIDGKHIKVKCPSNSGSSYFCYKNFFFHRSLSGSRPVLQVYGS